MPLVDDKSIGANDSVHIMDCIFIVSSLGSVISSFNNTCSYIGAAGYFKLYPAANLKTGFITTRLIH